MNSISIPKTTRGQGREAMTLYHVNGEVSDSIQQVCEKFYLLKAFYRAVTTDTVANMILFRVLTVPRNPLVFWHVILRWEVKSLPQIIPMLVFNTVARNGAPLCTRLGFTWKFFDFLHIEICTRNFLTSGHRRGRKRVDSSNRGIA